MGCRGGRLDIPKSLLFGYQLTSHALISTQEQRGRLSNIADQTVHDLHQLLPTFGRKGDPSLPNLVDQSQQIAVDDVARLLEVGGEGEDRGQAAMIGLAQLV